MVIGNGLQAARSQHATIVWIDMWKLAVFVSEGAREFGRVSFLFPFGQDKEDQGV